MSSRETSAPAASATPIRDSDQERRLLHRVAGLTTAWVTAAEYRLDRARQLDGNRAATRSLSELLDEMSDVAADLGGWAVLAHHALRACDDLSAADCEAIATGMLAGARMGAHAWAHIEGARRRLAVIEGRCTGVTE